MTDHRALLVASGYDAMIDTWEDWKNRIEDDPRDEWCGYVLSHVPRELLAPLFGRIHTWLRPGGLFLATLGASDLPGWTGDFLGAPSYFSGYPPETNRRLLADAGFTLARDEAVSIREPEGDATFHWILGQR